MAEDADGGQNAPGGASGGAQGGGQETAAAVEEPPEHAGGEEIQGTNPPSSEVTPAQSEENKDDTDSGATEVLESKDDGAREEEGPQDNAPAAAPGQGVAGGGQDGVTPPSTGGITFSGTEDQDPIPPLGGMKGPLKDKTKATQRQGRALMALGSDPSSLTIEEVDMQIAALERIKAERELALALRDEQTPPTWDDNRTKTKATQRQGRALRVPGGPKLSHCVEALDFDAMTDDEAKKMPAMDCSSLTLDQVKMMKAGVQKLSGRGDTRGVRRDGYGFYDLLTLREPRGGEEFRQRGRPAAAAQPSTSARYFCSR